jgi:hypothetical protein
MKKIWYCLFLITLIVACGGPNEAEKIINKSVEAHGGERLKSAQISFTFRDRQYEIFKSPDAFNYSRSFTEDSSRVIDYLNNEGFSRTVNGERVTLSDKNSNAYANSVNSVAYFAFLPYGLNDAAVIKEYLGMEELEGNDYHVIKVTFEEDGGGEDHQDEFLYWIDQEDFLIDYMAYTYHTDGGGLRFRKAIKSHEVSGLILQDYENYKPEDETIPVEDISTLFKQDRLSLLSEILLEDIRVEIVQ